MTGFHKSTQQRDFWLWVNKSAANGCWEWLGSCMITGYAQLSIRISDGPPAVYKHCTAHRWSYILHHDAIPDGLDVLHHCDNKKCVNPAHLFVGTAKDNFDDMVRKGRRRLPRPLPGSLNGSAKLNEEQVRQIIQRLQSGESQRSISSSYGVIPGIVGLIKRNKKWRHIPREVAI